MLPHLLLGHPFTLIILVGMLMLGSAVVGAGGCWLLLGLGGAARPDLALHTARMDW